MGRGAFSRPPQCLRPGRRARLGRAGGRGLHLPFTRPSLDFAVRPWEPRLAAGPPGSALRRAADRHRRARLSSPRRGRRAGKRLRCMWASAASGTLTVQGGVCGAGIPGRRSRRRWALAVPPGHYGPAGRRRRAGSRWSEILRPGTSPLLTTFIVINLRPSDLWVWTSPCSDAGTTAVLRSPAARPARPVCPRRSRSLSCQRPAGSEDSPLAPRVIQARDCKGLMTGCHRSSAGRAAVL